MIEKSCFWDVSCQGYMLSIATQVFDVMQECRIITSRAADIYICMYVCLVFPLSLHAQLLLQAVFLCPCSATLVSHLQILRAPNSSKSPPAKNKERWRGNGR